MMNYVPLELTQKNIIERTSTMKSGERFDRRGLFEAATPFLRQTAALSSAPAHRGSFTKRKMSFNVVGPHHRPLFDSRGTSFGATFPVKAGRSRSRTYGIDDLRDPFHRRII